MGPVGERPVILDDTCYFVACSDAWEAALLNDPRCYALINSLVFWDSKRPITKKILQRIDLRALIAHVDHGRVLDHADRELQSMGVGMEHIASRWSEKLEKLLAADSAGRGNGSQLSFL